MKIDGKNCLTLSHTLTFLGSKNDTTAKYNEGFKNSFGTLHRWLFASTVEPTDSLEDF